MEREWYVSPDTPDSMLTSVKSSGGKRASAAGSGAADAAAVRSPDSAACRRSAGRSGSSVLTPRTESPPIAAIAQVPAA